MPPPTPVQTLCFGCMAARGAGEFCGICGWRHKAAPESPLPLPPGTVLDGRYLLGKVLGQGGFGITYLAWDLDLKRKLALKEYFPQSVVTRATDHSAVTPFSQQGREPFEYGLAKFVEEGRALARFQDHPGVVHVLQYFQANGTAYIVMQFIEGMTLHSYLGGNGGKLPFDRALAILMPVMDALREVHAAGMLHRDISPDNIYLSYSGQVKLLDFGATRYAMGEQSKSLSVILKPGYAPEEQYRSKGEQGPWTDVYALGATFYRCLTGQLCSDSPDRLHSDDLKPPGRLGVAIPPHSEAALLKALSVRAGDRFQTMAEFQNAVVERRAAPPPPPPPRRRDRWMLPAVGLLLTTILTAGGWVLSENSLRSEISNLRSEKDALAAIAGGREELRSKMPVAVNRVRVGIRQGTVTWAVTGPNMGYGIADTTGKLEVKCFCPYSRDAGPVTTAKDVAIPRADQTWAEEGSFSNLPAGLLNFLPDGIYTVEFWWDGKFVAERAVDLRN